MTTLYALITVMGCLTIYFNSKHHEETRKIVVRIEAKVDELIEARSRHPYPFHEEL